MLEVILNQGLNADQVKNNNPAPMKPHLLVRVQRRKLQRIWEKRSNKRKQLYNKFHSRHTLNHFQITEE